MEWGTPADIVHIGREDPARSQGLADGLMPTFPAHDHLMWDARKGRDIPAELVQQERQILAWRQILLLHDVVVSREGVHLWMVVGGRFHDLGEGLLDGHKSKGETWHTCLRMTCSRCQTLWACRSGNRDSPIAGGA